MVSNKDKAEDSNLTSEMQMHWYLIYTKSRQEKCAFENLDRQGYRCYLPTLPSEKLYRGVLKIVNEPLFPRYLFIRLGQGEAAQSWTPIRSTRGVCSLVNFGGEAVRADDDLIELLRAQEASLQSEPERLFKPGERVRLATAPFADINGVYQMTDGERRAMVLIEILSKPVIVRVPPNDLRKSS